VLGAYDGLFLTSALVVGIAGLGGGGLIIYFLVGLAALVAALCRWLPVEYVSVASQTDFIEQLSLL